LPETGKTVQSDGADTKKPRKLDLQEKVRTHWPFTRMDPKLLEKAHRQYKMQQRNSAEEAPF
jgi:hypothetical protein